MKSLLSTRKLGRGVYESPLLASLRKVHFERHAARESRRTRRILQALQFNPLTKKALSLLKADGKKTLFILGSGASVNRLTKLDYEQIGQGYSIGMNAWVSHSFVPDAYSFEADSSLAPPSLEIETMSAALSERALSHPDTVVLLLRPKNPGLIHRMVKVPDSLRHRTFMCGRQNLLTRTESALRKDLGALLSARYKNFEAHPVLIDNGASVVRMIGVGLFAGFKEIVLLGIDLNSSPYFWEAPDVSPANRGMRGLYQRPHNVEHDTTETFDRPYSNLLFIEELSRAAEQHFGARVYIGSEGSSLAGRLPAYNWDVNQSSSKRPTATTKEKTT